MIFSASDFTMDQMSPNDNKERSFVSLPPEPNSRNKSIGAHDRIPPDLENSNHRCTVTFAGGAFWNSPLRPYQEGPSSGRPLSSDKRNHRSPTFIRQIGMPHAAAARWSTSSAKIRLPPTVDPPTSCLPPPPTSK
jgi:hypothetical protein